MNPDEQNKELRPIDRLYCFAEWCKENELISSMHNFEVVCNLSSKYLSNSRYSSGNVSSDILCRVYKRFPQVNITWIVTGDESMIKTPHDEGYKRAYNAAMEQVKALQEIVNRLEREPKMIPSKK